MNQWNHYIILKFSNIDSVIDMFLIDKKIISVKLIILYADPNYTAYSTCISLVIIV